MAEESDSSPSGEFHSKRHRFETILTVPPEIQDRVFRWVSEFDLCDRCTTLGKALDTVSEMYIELLSQFSRTADVRDRFLQAPTNYMVAPMYFCERALDGIADTLLCVRRTLSQMFAKANEIKTVCFENYTAEHKLFCEMQSDFTAGQQQNAEEVMHNHITSKREKANTFLQLAKRLQSIADGGDSTFKYLHQQWDMDVAFQAESESDDGEGEQKSHQRRIQSQNNEQEATNAEKATGAAQEPQEGAKGFDGECTPEEQQDNHSGNAAQQNGKSTQVPETPEQPCVTSPCIEITQTSLQGKRMDTAEKRAQQIKKARISQITAQDREKNINSSQQQATRSHQSAARIVTPSASKQHNKQSAGAGSQSQDTKDDDDEKKRIAATVNTGEQNSAVKRRKVNPPDSTN